MEPPRSDVLPPLASSRPAEISESSLDQLHQSRIVNPVEIRRLLGRSSAERIPLRRALNRKILPETAILLHLGEAEMLLLTHNFEQRHSDAETWNLSATIDGTPYFFVVPLLERLEHDRAKVGVPTVLYKAERRDRVRRMAGVHAGPTRVILSTPRGIASEGEVEDFSPGGLGVLVASQADARLGQLANVQYLDGEKRGLQDVGEVRSIVPLASKPGWQRIGLAVRGVPVVETLAIEKRKTVVGDSRFGRVGTRMALAASVLRSGSLSSRMRTSPDIPSTEVRVLEYPNSRGERICAILDVLGKSTGAPVVVIPPAWGKTKETLLPLAATIIASFKKSKLPVSVLRFDGIRRKGESFNDPGCRTPGREYHRFTFSQGVRDIQATLDFLFGSSGVQPSSAVLVSFSAASIDARRAVALESDHRLSAWISVVGAPDLQSAMRTVSGGIDYLGGFERGVRFGLQEIQGVTVDMDYAAADAIEHRLAFMDDALRDMALISTPITWIHGRFDAWMDFERVKLLMGAGNPASRRLIEVPTGHQLRSSVEAIEVFQLIASEVGRHAGSGPIARGVPNAKQLKQRSDAERQRLPRPNYEPRKFWRDYLVGRDGHLGIELMTGTSAYESLMRRQVAELDLCPGQVVSDLGSGTGSLSGYLAKHMGRTNLKINELDFVPDALRRSRERLASHHNESPIEIASVVCDLSLADGGIPLADGSQDAVLGSLLISYLPNPERLLAEAWRILKPGGRLVLSTLRPDADTSRIYQEAVEELRSGRARALFGELHEVKLGESLHSFMNDAARLLDLEEQSVFRFFDETELSRLLEGIGFVVVGTERAFGKPPQAVLVSARRPAHLPQQGATTDS